MTIPEKPVADDGDFPLGKKFAARTPFVLPVGNDVANLQRSCNIRPCRVSDFGMCREGTGQGQGGNAQKNGQARPETLAPRCTPSGRRHQ